MRVSNSSTSGLTGNPMKRSMIRKERMLTIAGLAFCVGLGALTPPAEGMGRAPVQPLYSPLRSTMQSGPSLGARGRYARIQPVVRQVFDIPYMTRLAVGPEWKNPNEQQ